MLELRYRRAWLASVWLLVAAIVAASLWPAPVSPPEPGLDKLGHYGAYLLLALLGAGIVAAGKVWLAMLRTFLLGVVLEVGQAIFTASRSAEWADLAANAAGVLTAWALVAAGLAGWARRVEAWFNGEERH